MPAVASYSLTGNAYIDGLLGVHKWAVSNLTFSFPTSGSFYGTSYGAGEPLNAFGALNAPQQATVRAALRMYASVANLTFSETVETAGQHADLRFALSSKPGTAWAYFPATAAEGGDGWFNPTDYTSPVKGNYAYFTFLHEIGHALGLEHAHEGNVMPQDRDTLEYTVMSYRSSTGASLTSGYRNETWGYAQSLMMYDIAALQHMYGANFSTNSGNTTYAWSPTTGEMFVNGVAQGAPGGNRILLTVWDGGGNDTYDFSNYATNLRVDLRPGAWTTISTAQLARLHWDGSKAAMGNIANALLYRADVRSLVENAVGGSGNDVLTGNQAANLLKGGVGHDTITGGDGSDTLEGGLGSDSLTGGLGADVFLYRHFSDGGDIVSDFTSGEDRFAFSADFFSKGRTGGIDAAGVRFFVDGGAQTTDPSFLFQRSTGSLYWDNDGIGMNPAVLIAKLNAASSSSQVKQFAWLSHGSVDQIWAIRGAGDLNGDGTSDILWRNTASGEVGLWGMVNGWSTGYRSLGVVDLGWSVQQVGDLNGDGTSDILWRNTASGEVGLWGMVNGWSTGYRSLGVVDLGWSVQQVGDLNGDGTSDILWRNTASGEVFAWNTSTPPTLDRAIQATDLWFI